jgi:hypothetical protein
LPAALALTSLLGSAGAPERGAAAEDAAPRLVAAERERDLGVLAPGTPARAEFRIENHGAAPLALEARAARPFVAGVRVEVRGAPVAPGGAATVTIEVETGRLAGKGRVAIPIATNDAAAREVILALTLDVRPVLVAHPGYARYITVQQEREGTITQSVWASDGATFRVLRVDSPTPDLRVEFHEATAEERRPEVRGSQWQVATTLASDAAVGALRGDVVVITDHPRQQRLRVELSGFVRPILAATPPVADLGEVDLAAVRPLSLHLKNFASEDITVERAEADLPGISVEVKPISPGRVYALRVTPGVGLPAGDFQGAIRVFTTSGKVPAFEIPLRGRVARAAAAQGG